MESLSGIASVIALVQLRQLIGVLLKKYYYDGREARADIDGMFTTIKGHEDVLTSTEGIANFLFGLIQKTCKSIYPVNYGGRSAGLVQVQNQFGS